MSVTTQHPGDWTDSVRGIYIPLDLEYTPLEIKTDSELGSEDEVDVYFYTTQGEYAGGVAIYFSSTLQYAISSCSSYKNFPGNLPVEVEKVWRITVDKTAGIRVRIHCNGVEVLNFLLSDKMCSDSRWRYYWSRDVEEIYFYPNFDTASDYYRAVKKGILHLRQK